MYGVYSIVNFVYAMVSLYIDTINNRTLIYAMNFAFSLFMTIIGVLIYITRGEPVISMVIGFSYIIQILTVSLIVIVYTDLISTYTYIIVSAILIIASIPR